MANILRRAATWTFTRQEGGPARGTIMALLKPETVAQSVADYETVSPEPILVTLVNGVASFASLIVNEDPTINGANYYDFVVNLENTPTYTVAKRIPVGGGTVNLATLPNLQTKDTLYGVAMVRSLNEWIEAELDGRVLVMQHKLGTAAVQAASTTGKFYNRFAVDAAGHITAVGAEANSPMDFGAVGDGETDDIDALDTMVAELPSNSTIHWEGRQYAISRPFRINIDESLNVIEEGAKTFNMEFEGGGLTQLPQEEEVLASHSFATYALMHIANADHLVLRDGNFVGIETPADWVPSPVRAGIRITSSDHILVENNRVSYKTYGLFFETSYYGTVRTFFYHGVMEAGGLSGANHSSGIRISEGGFHLIDGLTAQYTGSGFSVIGHTTTNLLVTNILVDGFYDNGIYISGGQKCEISNARILGRGFGTGIKTRGDFHRVSQAYVQDVIAGYALSGLGSVGGGVYQGVGEVSHEHNGVEYTHTYVGRGAVFDNVTAVNCANTGFEIQNRPYNADGDEAFPYDCTLSNAYFENVCTDTNIVDGDEVPTESNAVLIRGFQHRVHNVVINKYMGSTVAFKAQGDNVASEFHTFGYDISKVTLVDAPNGSGIQLLYVDDSILDGCRVEAIKDHVGNIGIYITTSDGNQIRNNVAKDEITGKGMWIHPTSLGNHIHGNDVSTLEVDRLLNPDIINNRVGGRLQDGILSLANRMMAGDFGFYV